MLKIQEEIVLLLECRPSENFSLLWEMLFSVHTCLEPPCMPCLPLENYGRERIVNKYIMNRILQKRPLARKKKKLKFHLLPGPCSGTKF